MGGWNRWEQVDDELTEMVRKEYGSFIHERTELKIIQLDNPIYKFYKYYDEEEACELHIPNLETYAIMIRKNNLLIKSSLDFLIKQLAEFENKLLKDCTSSDFAVQTFGPTCFTWKDNQGNTWALLRKGINSTQTPNLHDVRENIGYHAFMGSDWLRQVDSCPKCGAPIRQQYSWFEGDFPLQHNCRCRYNQEDTQ